MEQSTQYCKKCGVEITDKKMEKCPSCGTKISKPIYKKWWFWIIIGIIAVAIGSGTASNGSSDSFDSGNPTGRTYETVDLQAMIDELNENALKAEKTYQNKYVCVTGKIASFDSDGSYITIEPVNAGQWNLDTVTCYIKKDSQRELLLTKSKGDTVTIKGKIKSIGEFLGYSLNIDEIE